jgi:hypothetical protein
MLQMQMPMKEMGNEHGVPQNKKLPCQKCQRYMGNALVDVMIVRTTPMIFTNATGSVFRNARISV